MKKIIHLSFLLIATFIFISISANAQPPCEICPPETANPGIDPPILTDPPRTCDGLYKNAGGPCWIIPVVIHIIHSPDSEYGSIGNPSNQLIFDFIERLNKDFRGDNDGLDQVSEPFCELIGDCKIEFRLHDIVKEPSSLVPFGSAGQSTIQNLSPKSSSPGTDRYLHLWFTQIDDGPNVGRECPLDPTYPGSNTSCADDGVVASVESLTNGFPLGTHEIAHWLGLRHVAGSSFDGEYIADDLIYDTPCQATGASASCDLDTPSADTEGCVSNPDIPTANIQNFMQSPSDCRVMFTKGQCAWMQEDLAEYRPEFYVGDPDIPCDGHDIEARSNGISRLSNPYFNVAPNPSNGLYNFYYSRSGTLKIFDPTAKLIFNRALESESGNYTIDLSNYSSGIYYLNFSNEKNSRTIKLIKE